MKKIYNKLCAIAFALLGATSLSAQTDVTSTYLTNAGFDDESGWATSNVGVTSGGNMQDIPGWTKKAVGWSSGATFGYGGGGQVNGSSVPSTGPDGTATGGAFGFSGSWSADITYTQEVTLPAGVYTLSYKVYNAQTSTDGNNKLATNKFGFVASSGTTYYGATTTFTSSVWTEASTTIVLTAETSGNISIGATFPGASSSVTPRLIVDGVTLTHKPLTDVTEANPVDLTSMVSNTKAAWTGATETPNYDGITMVARYAASDWTGDALSQTISGLPVGKYQMEVYCQAHSSWDTDVASEGATGYTYLSANEYKLDVPIRNADGATTKALYTFEDMTITNGTLRIAVVNEKLAANWISVYVKSLTFLGPDKTLSEEAFTANVANLNALSTNDVPTAFATKISNLKSTYGSADASSMTLTELTTANGDIQAVVDAHPSMVAAYADLQTLITLCTNYASEDYSNVENEAQRTALTIAIATATTNGNNATSVAELTSAYNTLEAARQTFVLVAYPTSGNSYEMTFKIANPSFETGDLTGWTIVQYSSDTGVKANSNATYATTGTDGNYLFNTYWQGVPIKQTLTNLPSGTYTMTAAVASDGCTVYLTADSEHSAGITTSDKTVFLDTQIEFICTDGEVTIGAVGGANGDAADHKDFVEAGYWWYKADNFRLTRTFDATTMQTSLTALKTTAASLLEQAMEPSKKTALQSAYDKADTSSENPFDLSAWAAELETTIAAAQSSANDYSKIQEYINKTKVFVDESEVATYQNKYDNREYTSEDVEPVRRELNVMRFNAASEVFTQKIEVTGWTGDLANTLRNDQHWSGNTVSYYDANSWVNDFVGLKHTLTTTITLPQGSYVLKAAGRSSSDATLRLNIKNGDTTIETVEYTGKGDQGYGIDTSGAANFSAEGIYANPEKDGNGNVLSYIGRGWEWEFAKFELNTETTVTLLVEVDYNDIQNRFGSFSDITLWMDDDTYLSVNGGAIDAPLAQAKALNTLPMGDSEMSALTSAIALGEAEITTADQLNEALAALETAVANANTWRTAYNEAKAPLLKAFDRFEYGFNNGAEGRQVETMNDDAWTALLEAVKTAGADKDITNSYAHFADATTNFNTAMDVAMAQFSMAEQYNSTYYIANADCAVNDAWVGNGRSTATGQHWSGDAERVYFTQNVDGTARTQTISLPYNGWYLLRASVRAANEDTFSKVIVDGVEYTANGPHGTVGGTIATDGSEWDSVADGIAAGKTFANNNAGYGWVYKYIPIKITDATKDVTIGINLTENASNIGGMDLFFTGKNCHFKEDDIVKHYGDYATGFATTHTTHDVTNATMSGLSLDVTNNPNTIILATEGQVTNEKNVVINGTCANFVLTDGYDFNAVQDFTATETSYNRSFATDTWSTVILPFAHTVSDGVKVEKLKGLLLNHNGKNYIQFDTVEEMEAHTPYIVQNASFTNLGEKAIKATTNLNTIEGSEATMKGTYKAVTAKELVDAETSDILFVNAAGEGKYIDDEVATDEITFRAFRAYITVANDMFSTSAGVAPQFFIFHGDDDITAIEETLNQKNEEEVIYDLAGRRIVKPTKAGIYIVNGKKMVIK